MTHEDLNSELSKYYKTSIPCVYTYYFNQNIKIEIGVVDDSININTVSNSTVIIPRKRLFAGCIKDIPFNTIEPFYLVEKSLDKKNIKAGTLFLKGAILVEEHSKDLQDFKQLVQVLEEASNVSETLYNSTRRVIQLPKMLSVTPAKEYFSCDATLSIDAYTRAGHKLSTIYECGMNRLVKDAKIVDYKEFGVREAIELLAEKGSNVEYTVSSKDYIIREMLQGEIRKYFIDDILKSL